MANEREGFPPADLRPAELRQEPALEHWRGTKFPVMQRIETFYSGPFTTTISAVVTIFVLGNRKRSSDAKRPTPTS
jgi:hypothetical protein